MVEPKQAELLPYEPPDRLPRREFHELRVIDLTRARSSFRKREAPPSWPFVQVNLQPRSTNSEFATQSLNSFITGGQSRDPQVSIKIRRRYQKANALIRRRHITEAFILEGGPKSDRDSNSKQNTSPWRCFWRLSPTPLTRVSTKQTKDRLDKEPYFPLFKRTIESSDVPTAQKQKTKWVKDKLTSPRAVRWRATLTLRLRALLGSLAPEDFFDFFSFGPFTLSNSSTMAIFSGGCLESPWSEREILPLLLGLVIGWG